MFAPSSFVSAAVSWSAPVVRVLMRSVVNSWRVVTTPAFEESVLPFTRSVARAASNSAAEVVMLASSAQAPIGAAIKRPAELAAKPVIVRDEVPPSLKFTTRLPAARKLVPL